MNRFTWTDKQVTIKKGDKAKNYSPSQPRDEKGQFSGGGSSSEYLYKNTLPNYSMKPSEGHTILYTNTRSENINSISEQGLKTGMKQTGYGASPEEGNVIWTDTRSPDSTAYGGNTIAFQVTNAEAKAWKVNDTQHAVAKNIETKDILFVDRVLKHDSGVKVSSLPEYVKKYGKEKTADVIANTGDGISKEDVISLIERYESTDTAKNYSEKQPRDKSGKWSGGGGSSIGDFEVSEEYYSKFNDYENKVLDNFDPNRSGFAEYLQKKTGGNAKATKVDKLSKDSQVIHRGWAGKRYAEEWISSDNPRASYGAFGDGTYFAQSKDTAGKYNAHITTFGIKSSAKGITYEKATALMRSTERKSEKLFTKLRQEAKGDNKRMKEVQTLTNNARQLYYNAGAIARVNGYDYIKQETSNDPYYVILNRGVIEHE